MTKKEFIERISKFTGLTKKGTAEVVEAVFDGMREIIIQEKTFVWPDFGAFKVDVKAAKKGRNPRTGEEIEIPERRVLKFKVSNGLKKALNSEP